MPRMSASAAAPNPAHRRSHRSRPSCSRSCRSPPALRSAPPRAVRAAAPAAQSPRRLRSAVLAGDDFPIVNAVRFGRPDRPGRPRFSHPTHLRCRGRMRALVGPCRCLSASSHDIPRRVLVGPSRFSGEPRSNYWKCLIFRDPVLQRTAHTTRKFPREPPLLASASPEKRPGGGRLVGVCRAGGERSAALRPRSGPAPTALLGPDRRRAACPGARARRRSTRPAPPRGPGRACPRAVSSS